MILKKQTSSVLIILLTIVMVFAFSACGQKPADDKAKDEPKNEELVANKDAMQLFADGKLTVATGEPAWEPWVKNDDPASGEGFEAALVYAIADYLGFAKEEVEWVRTTFDQALTPGPKDYDFNLQQFSITEERKQAVDFSSAYYHEPRVIITMKDGKYATSTSMADFKGATFGAASGDIAIQITEDLVQPDNEVQVFNDLSGVLAALNTGQIDATVAGVAEATFIVNISDQLSGNGVISGVIPGSAEFTDGLALLLPKDSPNTAILSKAIDDLTADGTIEGLINEWLSDYTSVPDLTE